MKSQDKGNQNYYTKLKEIPAYPLAHKNNYPIDSLKSDLFYTLKDFVLKLFWIYKFITYYKEYKALRNFVDTKITQKCIVLGNGPSLNNIDAKFLINFKKEKGEIFVVNNFHLNDSLSQVNPDFFFSSDPVTHLEENFQNLRLKLQKNLQCKIFVPFELKNTYEDLFPEHTVIGFCNIEIRRNFFSPRNSIRPDRPRSYSAMTAYSALALAKWMNYQEIFVIGIDNTYLSDVICDEKNKIYNILNHSSIENRIQEVSSEYSSIFDYFYEHSRLFYDLYKFKSDNVINLDPNSLVDSFRKSMQDKSFD